MPALSVPPRWRALIAVLVAVLTAAMGVVMFPPYDGAEAAYVWLVPLALWLGSRPTRRAVWWVAGSAGWLQWIVLLSWLRHSPAAIDLPGAWFLGWGMTIALAGVVALFFVLWVRLAAWLLPQAAGASFGLRLLGWAGLAGLWVVLEWLRGWIFTGFPWLPIAASQWQRPLLLQTVAWTGAAGLSFLLVYFNLAIAFYVRTLVAVRRVKWWQRLSPDFYSALGLLAVAIFAGMSALAERERSRPLLKAAFVQPDLPPAQHWDSESVALVNRLAGELFVEAALTHTDRRTDDWLALFALTPSGGESTEIDASVAVEWDRRLPGGDRFPPIRNRDDVVSRALVVDAAWPGDADVVLWPEVSLPALAVGADQQLHPTYGALTAIAERTLIHGALTADESAFYNAIVVTALDAAGEVTVPAIYHKRRLVPFGEYVPFAHWLPWLETIVPIPGSLAAGREMVLLPVTTPERRVRLAPLICYEDLYAGLAREGVKAGADALFVATNNAWFGDHAGPLQHAAHSVLRAVETRRPVLRVGNAGWSGWIDEYGYIRWQMTEPQSGEMAFRGVDSVAVTRDPRWTRKQSLYVQAGDWGVGVAALFFLVAVVSPRRMRPLEVKEAEKPIKQS